MSRTTLVTRARGGTAEQTLPAGDIVVPDLWHIYIALKNEQRPQAAEAVLEVWHLAHDLLKHITGAEINPSPCAVCNGLGTVPNDAISPNTARVPCPACAPDCPECDGRTRPDPRRGGRHVCPACGWYERPSTEEG